MIFREATENDVAAIATIFDDARAFMRMNGSDQWRPDYPVAIHAHKDINRRCVYVLEDNGTIAAYCAVIFEGEAAYSHPTCRWAGDRPFAVIHRMAVAAKYRSMGLSKLLIKNVIELCRNKGPDSLRIDTRCDNHRMISLLKSHGFKPCGHCTYIEAGRREVFELCDF